MRLVEIENKFVFLCTYDERMTAKDAGFRWDPKGKQWWTPEAAKAAKLVRYADPDCRVKLRGAVAQVTETLQASRATDSDIVIPCPPGLAYLPYQKGGVHYGVSRNSVLIADEPGLGKTWQATGILEVTNDYPAVIVVPASLKLNWVREISRLAPTRSTFILNGKPDRQLIDFAQYFVSLDPTIGRYTSQKGQNVRSALKSPLEAGFCHDMGITRTRPRRAGVNSSPNSALQPSDDGFIGVVDRDNRSSDPIVSSFVGVASIGATLDVTFTVDKAGNVRQNGNIIDGSEGRGAGFPLAKTADPQSGSPFNMVVKSHGIHPKRLGQWGGRLSKIGRLGDGVGEIGLRQFLQLAQYDCLILNYDIAGAWQPVLLALAYHTVILDESHNIKNPKAKRTKTCISLCEAAIRKILLTGTPVLNRPNELWTTVHLLDPTGLGRNFMGYHQRYCDATRTRWGWDFTGASNLPELQRRLRETIMIRRLKTEVLTELPPKRRQVIELALDDAGDVVTAEKAAWEAQEEILERARLAVLEAEAAGDDDAYEAAIKALKSAQMVAFASMSKVRHDTAVKKIPAIIEHLEEAIEGSGKVVFFAHHLDVLHAVHRHFGAAAVLITGETKIQDRQAAVDRFQTDPCCTLFTGGILPAGVGITLTASSHVVFGEIDWRPGIVTQAEDRTHRIGQDFPVLIQHLVIDGSIDALMSKRIIAKQEVIDAALDKGMAAPAADLDEFTEGEPVTVPRPQNAVIPMPGPSRSYLSGGSGQDLTPAQVAAVHQAIRYIASMDSDRAREVNGMGFNKIDGSFGHSLAAAPKLTQNQAKAGLKLCRKYRRQIGEEMMAALS